MKKKKKKRIRGGIQSHKEKQLRLKANDEETAFKEVQKKWLGFFQIGIVFLFTSVCCLGNKLVSSQLRSGYITFVRYCLVT